VNGVNPSVGVRVRNNEPLPDRTPTPRVQALRDTPRLENDIILEMENDEDLYNRICLIRQEYQNQVLAHHVEETVRAWAEFTGWEETVRGGSFDGFTYINWHTLAEMINEGVITG